ncbi:MAG TPA: substrate-binding domain-containing protein [Mycobacteriales bacterium]|nr:substrate-binding domain-containing protein [Mycobacteriales bacterium]
MLAVERSALIMQLARRSGSVRVAELVTRLCVSDVTVRRDLDRLVRQGMLHKVHGGAVLTDPPGRVRRSQPPPPTAATAATAEPVPTIGVLVPKSPYYFQRVIDGIRAALPAAQNRLLLAVSDYEPARERELVDGLLGSGAEALLIAPAAIGDHTDHDWVGRLEVPTVLLERRFADPETTGASSVRTAHESGAIAAIRHLYGLGHRRIALFARGDTPTSQSVRQGWLDAIGNLGLPDGLPDVSGAEIAGWPKWDRPRTRRLGRKLRKAGITALLCHSDEDALGLLQNGLSDDLPVPARLSIVAYDDEFSEFARPTLTAVSPAKRQLGALAARTLLELVADPDAPARHIDVLPRLIVRDSTARNAI